MPMREKVEAALAKVRPMLQADGGDVELVEITDRGIVKVRLTGRCKTCPMSQQTLKGSVERVVMREVRGIKAVEEA
jgi:Fe-S cluster biogenesis protein NfuA